MKGQIPKLSPQNLHCLEPSSPVTCIPWKVVLVLPKFALVPASHDLLALKFICTLYCQDTRLQVLTPSTSITLRGESETFPKALPWASNLLWSLLDLKMKLHDTKNAIYFLYIKPHLEPYNNHVFYIDGSNSNKGESKNKWVKIKVDLARIIQPWVVLLVKIVHYCREVEIWIMVYLKKLWRVRKWNDRTTGQKGMDFALYETKLNYSYVLYNNSNPLGLLDVSRGEFRHSFI